MKSKRIRPTNISPPDAPADPVTAWAEAVRDGEVVAGPHVRNACKRHLDDLKRGPDRGLYWDIKAVTRALGFFPEVLRLAGGQFEGLKFELQPSQQFIVGSIFGWKRADGSRRFRRAYIEQAKGSGKSPLAAGIGHYCLMADGEARAEVYAAAANTAQAMVLFRDAVAMRAQSPALSSRLTPSGGNPVWNLADLTTGSFFRPISSEARKAGSGPRPHCALCDEVHEHPDGLTVEMLERGFKWRRQPLLLMTTNSGSDRQSICWTEHEWAVRVAAGTMTPDDDFTYVGEVLDGGDTEFSFVCGLDRNDDPLNDPSCWIKANPLLGVTMREENLAEAVAQAKAIPGKLNGVLRLNFCQWTEADTAWISREALEAVLADFDPLEFTGEEIALGADLGATRDMAAIGCVVQTGEVEVETPDGQRVIKPTYHAWIEAWSPGGTLKERALRDRAPYDIWVEQGHLNAPPGNVLRLEFMAARVAQLQAEYQIKALGYDRYAFRQYFEPALDEMGVTCETVEHPQGGKKRASPSEAQRIAAQSAGSEPQGLWMPGSLSALETLILERRITIQRNPVFVSAAMSAVIERDPFDNRWFSKRKATNRIDALVALTMAVGVAEQRAVVVDVFSMVA